MTSNYSEVVEFLRLVDASEEEALSALLSAFGPPQPGALRGAWRKNARFGNSAPTTKDFWSLFTSAGFACKLCQSRLRLTVDHIDGNATNHALANLRVLCFKCNRDRVGSTISVERQNVAVYRAAMQLRQIGGSVPSNKDVEKQAGVKIGGATYLLKFLRTVTSGGTATASPPVEDEEQDDDADFAAELEVDRQGCEHI